MLGNREDLALHGMVSDLGLNCLSLSYKKDARLIWVWQITYQIPLLLM